MRQIQLFKPDLSKKRAKAIRSLERALDSCDIDQFEDLKNAVTSVKGYFEASETALDMKNNDIQAVYEMFLEDKTKDPIDSIENLRLKYLVDRVFNEDRAYKYFCNGLVKIHTHGKRFDGVRWSGGETKG